jgi:rhodanese-related sulfurtransferase
VQATDEYIGVRNARVVLVDPTRIRSVMTASWLNQMGWDDIHVLEPQGEDGLGGWPLARAPQSRCLAGFSKWQTITPRVLHAQSGDPHTAVIDLSTSLDFRNRHIPDAWWAVRSRLDEARARLPQMHTLVLTSRDGVLAHYAAPEASAMWPEADVRVLEGGNAGWLGEGLDTETGLVRATTAVDDVWYKPYEHAEDYAKHARAYLTWEVALADQVVRDPTIRFRDYR